jgi:hypothetical protein
MLTNILITYITRPPFCFFFDVSHKVKASMKKKKKLKINLERLTVGSYALNQVFHIGSYALNQASSLGMSEDFRARDREKKNIVLGTNGSGPN